MLRSIFNFDKKPVESDPKGDRGRLRVGRYVESDLTDEQLLKGLDEGYFRDDFDPIPKALEDLSLDLSSANELGLNDGANDNIDSLYGPNPIKDEENSKSKAASQELETVMNDYETKANIVEHRLHGLILDNYHEFVKGLADVEQVSNCLQDASKLCRNARRDLSTSKQDIAQDAFRTLIFERKRARILAVLSIFKEVRKLGIIQEELEECLSKGALPEAAERYRDAQQTALADKAVGHLKRVTAAAIPIAHIAGYGEAIWGQIVRSFEDLTRTFDDAKFIQLIRPTLTLGRKAGDISSALESAFKTSIASVPWVVLKDFVSPEIYDAVELPPAASLTNIQDVKTSRALKTLASKVENTSFSTAYIKLLSVLASVLYSSYRIPRLLMGIAHCYEVLANEMLNNARDKGSITPELNERLNKLPPNPLKNLPESHFDFLNEKQKTLLNISDIIMVNSPISEAALADEQLSPSTVEHNQGRARSPSYGPSAADNSAEVVLQGLDQANIHKIYENAIGTIAAVRESNARLVAVSSGFIQSQGLAWTQVQCLISCVLEGRKLTLAHISLEDFLQILLCSYRLVIVGSQLTGISPLYSAPDLARALFAKSRDFVRSFQREGIEVLRTNFTQDVWRPLPIRSDFALAKDVQELRVSEDEGSQFARSLAEGLAALVFGVAESQSGIPAISSSTTTGTVRLGGNPDDIDFMQSSVGAFAASLISPTGSSNKKSNKRAIRTKTDSTEKATMEEIASSTKPRNLEGPNQDAASQLIWKQFSSGRSPFDSLTKASEDAATEVLLNESNIMSNTVQSDLDISTFSEAGDSMVSASSAKTSSLMPSPEKKPREVQDKQNDDESLSKPTTAAERLALRIKSKEAQLKRERLGISASGRGTYSISKNETISALNANGLLGVDAVGTPVRVVTTSAMTTVRYIGKYLSIVRDLSPLASEAMKGLSELVNYFAYAIAVVHCPNTDVFCEEHYREKHAPPPPQQSSTSLLSGSFLSSSTGSNTLSQQNSSTPNGSGSLSNHSADSASMIAAAESRLSSLDRKDPFSNSFIPPQPPTVVSVADGSLRPNPFILPTSAASGSEPRKGRGGPLTKMYPALAQLILSVKKQTEMGLFASGIFGEHSASYILAARALADRANEDSKNKLTAFLRRATTSSGSANVTSNSSHSHALESPTSTHGSLESIEANPASQGQIGDSEASSAHFISIIAPKIASSSLDSINEPSVVNLGAALERIAAVESFAFVAASLESLAPRFLSLLPENHHAAFNSLVHQARLIAQDLRAYLIHTLPPIMLPSGQLRDQILSNNKWDVKSIATSASPYVDTIVTVFKSLEEQLGQLKLHGTELLPSFTVSCLKANSLYVLSTSLIEALSRVKKCSTPGRAAMALDTRVLAQELERIMRIGKPLPHWHLVTDYVSAYYFPEADFVEWIRSKGGSRYSLPQLTALANLVHVVNMKKQRTREYTAEVERAYAEGFALLSSKIEEEKKEIESLKLKSANLNSESKIASIKKENNSSVEEKKTVSTVDISSPRLVEAEVEKKTNSPSHAKEDIEEQSSNEAESSDIVKESLSAEASDSHVQVSSLP